METRTRKRQRTEVEDKKKNRKKKTVSSSKAENPSSAKALDINKNVNSNSTQNEKEKEEKEPAADLQCGICFEKPTVQGGLDSCSHIFCFKCIEKWSKTSNTCPFCKKRFRQILKKELNAPNKKPKKFKVKHKDMRAEEGYEPESWISWSDSEDDSDYDDRFGLIPPVLFDSFTLELMSFMHEAMMFESEDEWDCADDDDLDEIEDEFDSSENEALFGPAYIDLTNEPDEDEHQQEEEEEREEDEESNPRRGEKGEEEEEEEEEDNLPNSGQEAKEEGQQQQLQHVNHSPVSSHTRSSARRTSHRNNNTSNNSNHTSSGSSRSRSGSIRKRK